MLAIGIDVGGTTVKSALLEIGAKERTDSYRILKTAVVKTDTSGGRKTVLQSIVTAKKKVFAEGVQVIGVGSAGDVDPDSGIVTFATQALPEFTGLDLYAELNRRFGLPTVVINDASAASIGECFFGAGKGFRRVLVLTLGTGLGCSMYRMGETGALTSETVVNYREVGHTVLHPDGRTCLCGLKGCAEQYVSATALKRNAEEAGLKPNVAELIKQFKKGNPDALWAVESFFRDFTEVLKKAERDYAPELVVVGGGVTEAEGWWEAFVNYAAKEVSVPLKRAELKNKAGFLGAVYNALNGKYIRQQGVEHETI